MYAVCNVHGLMYAENDIKNQLSAQQQILVFSGRAISVLQISNFAPVGVENDPAGVWVFCSLSPSG